MFKSTVKIAAFGLVEVLIAALILSIGLLGLVALQNRAMKTAQEGDNIITAAVIAEEMAKRMLTNTYRTSLGRQGYLATDLNGDINSYASVEDWATNVLNMYPDIARCYAADNTQSCLASGGSFTNSADHQQALLNMQRMDEVEMRLLAARSLPDGQIKICFDNSNFGDSFDCDNATVRSTILPENLFTVKVSWTDIVDGSQKIYFLQFTAQCTDPDPSYCG